MIAHTWRAFLSLDLLQKWCRLRVHADVFQRPYMSVPLHIGLTDEEEDLQRFRVGRGDEATESEQASKDEWAQQMSGAMQ